VLFRSSLPTVLLPYQQELLAAVTREAVTAVEKSRRTGYSWAIAYQAVLTASAQRGAGGMDVYYMGYNLEMAREFVGYVGDAAKAFGVAIREAGERIFADPEHPEKSIKAFRVSFDSGFEVIALPSVPRALRGMQGLVIIDEAAFHDELDELLKAAFALLIWGGKVVVISTHNGETNPFNVLIQDIRAGRKPYKLLRCTFDDALEQGLYRRICLKSGTPWSEGAEATWRASIIAFYGSGADEELFCIPSAGSGTWLSAALIEARSEPDIPVLRWEPPRDMVLWPEHLRQAEVRGWCEEHLRPVLATLAPDTPHVFGWDFGRYHDLSVLWLLAIGKDLVRRTPAVVELRGVPSEEQQGVLWYVLDRLPLLRAGGMDAGGMGFTVAENTMKRYGPRVAMVTLNEPWYREQTPPLKAAFEDAMITAPRDREITDDLRLMKVVRGVARVPDQRSGDPGKKRHGDSAIALMLAYAASRAEPEEYAYEAVRRPARPDTANDDDDDRPGARRELRGALA
jgi:phage FluMu gp28-like protein